MKKNYLGLDMLRGLGIFVLLWMHTAFYYFDGVYDLDLNNPPPIVTLIGLMLMFAGIFAMLSGSAHTIQFQRKIDEGGFTPARLLRYNTVNGVLMLVIAWLYFIFTGPGLVDMPNRSMNNSILVELIRNGRLTGLNLERFLYVDSLVMLGMNLLLLGPIFLFFNRFRKKPWLVAGLGFFLLSLLRIPLYSQYLNAVDNEQMGIVLILNWLVNKNNPILPYLSFGMFGGWLGSLLSTDDWKHMVRKILPVGLILFIIGGILYVLLPDTMLQRSIDGKWFAIMTAQLGLFLLLILLALQWFDFRKSTTMKSSSAIRNDLQRQLFPLAFINRFGVAGLTPFFFESILSAVIFRLLRLFLPDLSFGLGGSLLYGFLLAITWGFLLVLWEKKQYRYGIEYFLCKILAPFGHSEKLDKLGRLS